MRAQNMWFRTSSPPPCQQFDTNVQKLSDRSAYPREDGCDLKEGPQIAITPVRRNRHGTLEKLSALQGVLSPHEQRHQRRNPVAVGLP